MEILQTAVLSIMYLSALGYVMVFGGIYINSTSDVDVTDQFKDYDKRFEAHVCWRVYYYFILGMLCISVYFTGIIS